MQGDAADDGGGGGGGEAGEVLLEDGVAEEVVAVGVGGDEVFERAGGGQGTLDPGCEVGRGGDGGGAVDQEGGGGRVDEGAGER